MYLQNDLEWKRALESKSKPKIEKKIWVIKTWAIKCIIRLIWIWLRHSFHECEVFKIIKMNESLEWFGI